MNNEQIKKVCDDFKRISSAKKNLKVLLEQVLPVGTEVIVTYGGHRTPSYVCTGPFGNNHITNDQRVWVKSYSTLKKRKVCICGLEGFENAF